VSWNVPVPATTGELFTAARYNTDVVGNLIFLKQSVDDTGLTWTGRVRNLETSFHGLHMRTHPDADVTANKIALLRLVEVIMSSGTRYQLPKTMMPLVADIATSGIGGLDAGVRTASTWYDIYLIGKSLTALLTDLRLLFHKTKTYTIDALFVPATNAARTLRIATGTPTDRLAQGVTFSTSGPLTYVDVIVQRQGSPVGSVWFSLQADIAGSPSGVPLVTSDKLSATTMQTISTIIRVPFRAQFSPTASTQYHLVMEGDYTRSDTNNISLFGVAAGGYAGGVAKEFNGTTWNAASGLGDFYFRTVLTLNDTSPILPTGYDEFCKLGQVYNNGSNILTPFIAFDKRVSLATLNLVSAGAGTTPGLFDASPAIPPGACVIQIEVGSSVSGDSIGIGSVPDGYQAGVNVGIRYVNSTGPLSPSAHAGLFNTEFQSMYFWRNAGTGTFFIYASGYEWTH